MTIITDKAMQAKPTEVEQWLTQPFKRGAGVFMARITPAGERLFYFRYTDSQGRRPFMPVGAYHPKGSNGAMTLSAAYKKASDLSALYQTGVRDLKEHFAAEEAKRIAELAAAEQRESARIAEAALEADRRITVKKLFDRWVKTELKPEDRANGTRLGRKDAGAYTRAQFERRVFEPIGEMEAKSVTKADLMNILDGITAEGKLRTANVLLADLKQMFRFAVTREIVERNPLESVTKKDVGGAEVGRDRVLSDDEVRALAKALPQANLTSRSQSAIWLILATGCRISELMNAEWRHVDLANRNWHLPYTKNQRPHDIHLSAFAFDLFQRLQNVRTADTKIGETPLPWVFPNAERSGPVCIKSFGKQLSDRQRPAERQMKHRTANTESLALSGGRWTAHDLRRTAATMMSRLDVSGDVIDECLNHVIESRVRRTYVRDRRLDQQARAFQLLGEKLSQLSSVTT